MIDLGLYLILATFIAWETVAHYAFHNHGPHTISNRVHWLERKGGWTVRAVVAAAVVALGVHLEGGF